MTTMRGRRAAPSGAFPLTDGYADLRGFRMTLLETDPLTGDVLIPDTWADFEWLCELGLAAWKGPVP